MVYTNLKEKVMIIKIGGHPIVTGFSQPTTYHELTRGIQNTTTWRINSPNMVNLANLSSILMVLHIFVIHRSNSKGNENNFEVVMNKQTFYGLK